MCVGAVGCAVEFQACPDFKGIKTIPGYIVPTVHGFKLALISKGLRPQPFVGFAVE